MIRRAASILALCLTAALAVAAPLPDASSPPRPLPKGGPFVPLFPDDGAPAGWTVHGWTDLADPAPPQALWTVRDGTLLGGIPRGTWLVSTASYRDFTMEFEFRLGERGCGAVGLRLPPVGNPETEGLVLRLVDPRFYGSRAQPPAEALTGALGGWLAPRRSVYKPGLWNRISITCLGSTLGVVLNGEEIQNLRLDAIPPARPAPPGPPLDRRPRQGRIGFLELSRANGQVEIRNARIRALEPESR